MRTISKRTQYRLKAMIALGQQYGKGPVLIPTLSEQEQIPIRFLEAILLDLKSRAYSAAQAGKAADTSLRNHRPPLPSAHLCASWRGRWLLCRARAKPHIARAIRARCGALPYTNHH